MQRFKKQFAFLFGMIAIAAYASIRFFPTEEATTPVIQSETTGNHMQIYMMDHDKTLIPISIPVDEEMSEEDQVNIMLGYMSGKQSLKGFSPLFTKEVHMDSFQINNGIIAVDFDDSLKNYTKENELRVLESLTWGLTQFHDVERVKLMMNGETLTAMPNGSTPIPEILNRSIGINHFETSTSALHTSDEMTVYYTKKVQGNTYMVPKSKRYPSTRSSLESKVNEIIEDVSVSSTLTQPMVKDSIKMESMSFEKGTLKVSLDEHILGADKTVKQDVYDSLTLSLLSLPSVEHVEVLVDDVVVSLQDEAKTVSLQDISYNEVMF